MGIVRCVRDPRTLLLKQGKHYREIQSMSPHLTPYIDATVSKLVQQYLTYKDVNAQRYEEILYSPMATARTQMMVHPSLGVHEFHYARQQGKQMFASRAQIRTSERYLNVSRNRWYPRTAVTQQPIDSHALEKKSLLAKRPLMAQHNTHKQNKMSLVM